MGSWARAWERGYLRIEEKDSRCTAVGEPENATKCWKALLSVSEERDEVNKAGKRVAETRAQAGLAEARTESNTYGKHEIWNISNKLYGTQPNSYGKHESFWNISTDFAQATAS